jgi:hypothetical protein
LYIDIFSNEEIVSDAFKFEWIFDNVGFKIKSNYKITGNEHVDIGCGNSFGGTDAEEEKVED